MRDGKPADLPEDNSELAPASAPRAPAPDAAGLFELDVPLGQPRPAAPPEPLNAGASAKSATDWMFELDTPVRAAPKDSESEAEALFDAPPQVVRADPSLPPAPLPPAVDPADIPGLSAEMARVAEPLPVRDATTPEGQRELRLDRLALRIQVVRDALRILGAMELKDDDRKPVARSLLQLGSTVLGPDLGQKLVKDPDATLASASDEQLDTLERALAQIEDKVLVLDELVPADTFRARIEHGKHAKKALARYARLLASRRFPVSERRNRFEWIATQLLSKTDANGIAEVLSPARARQVLDHLIGGLAHSVNEQELGEALAFLRESLHRLHRIASHDEFFDSEFYLDVHGYKITMRDQLVVPEFVYLSVLLTVHLRNRVEHWIQERERLFISQVRGEGDPRSEILTRMRHQEESVEDALGFKRKRPQPTPLQVEAPRAAKPAKRKAKSRRRIELSWDRNMGVMGLCALLILGSAGALAFQTGAVGAPTIQALSVENLALLSPLLSRGWFIGEGEERQLRANVHVDIWKKLDPRARRTEAERLLKILSSRGVPNATISDDDRVVIAIKDGFVAEVSGGKI